MRKFPKFLRALPEVYGLGIHELVVLLVVLQISFVFNLNPVLSMVISGIGMAVMKVARKNFDFVGLILPRKKEVYLSDIREEK